MSQSTIVEKIINYIENHLDEEISLDKIAEDLNYSKFYIARAFSKQTGITIYKYIQGRRLSLAAQKLVETKKPIIEIAYETQYNSQQAFTVAFSQLYSCTPQVFRKNGIFYPMQSRISMSVSFLYYSHTNYASGGKITA